MGAAGRARVSARRTDRRHRRGPREYRGEVRERGRGRRDERTLTNMNTMPAAGRHCRRTKIRVPLAWPVPERNSFGENGLVSFQCDFWQRAVSRTEIEIQRRLSAAEPAFGGEGSGCGR